METLKEFNDEYIRQVKLWRKRDENNRKKIKELQQQIKKLENKNLKHPSLIKVITPLAEQIRQKVNAKKFIHYGTFGLCCESPIYWMNEDNNDICKKGNVLGSLRLISRGNGWAIRNYNKKVNHYAKGSIAEMNGANYETIPITKDMDIRWLLKFIKRT